MDNLDYAHDVRSGDVYYSFDQFGEITLIKIVPNSPQHHLQPNGDVLVEVILMQVVGIVHLSPGDFIWS